ncbi:MAG TPA: LysR family transcriptional regulator [Solirubrobacterales bacterium]|nr:LysR family transcriptional regulator [Solirubrobacterales bacterium]
MGKLVRMPELVELRAFCAAVDLGSLGKAARLLQVSQPALSKRLRGLEALTGSRLLERSTRGVTPTPAGKRLHAAAQRLLAEAENVEALMEGLDAEQAPVRLAASPTMAEFALPALLVELESRHERHLSVALSVAHSDAARTLVLEGRAELGVVAAGAGAEADGLCESPFCEDEILVAVPAGHPWASKREIDPAELASTPTIVRDPGASSRRVVAAALATLDLNLAPPLAEIGSTPAAAAAALAESAPVFLSSLALAQLGGDGLTARPVAGLRFERRFVLVHCGEESLPAPARAFARHLLGSAGESGVEEPA